MPDWSYFFEGTGHHHEIDSIEKVREVMAAFVESVHDGDRYVMLSHPARYHRFLALVDSLGWNGKVLVYATKEAKPNSLIIIEKPDDLVPPTYPKARYGLQRCAWCALRLPWWRWDILPYCDACKPDPHQGGRPRFGRRALTRGSRWDTA